MSRIVLATSGSCGDVHPYIAVALGLRDLGHEVRIAAPESFRVKVQGEGLDFFPIRPIFVSKEGEAEESEAGTVRRTFNPVTGAAFLLRKLVLPCVEQTYSDLLKACTGADLMLIHPLLFPAPLVAEKLRMKWISVVLSPIVFVSAWDPPILPPLAWMQAFRGLGPLPYRVLLRALKALTRGWMLPLDRIRRREGLSAKHGHPMYDDMFSPYGTLAWFSSKMGAIQPDWPVPTEITGFPVYDRDEPSQLAGSSGMSDGPPATMHRPGLSVELEDFLAAGTAPVVFTLGSSAVIDPRDFYEQSRSAVERLGCRAIFVVGRDSPLHSAIEQHGKVFITGYAPFSDMFPRASAIVHQGGIGTTGQALIAGVPMLVVPEGLDQPDNAARAARLGVARILPRGRYLAGAVATNLQALLGQPDYASNARRVAAELRGENAVAAACSAIERILYRDAKLVEVPTVAAGTPTGALREAFAGSRARSVTPSKSDG